MKPKVKVIGDNLLDQIDERLLAALKEKADTIYGLEKRTPHARAVIWPHLNKLKDMGLVVDVVSESLFQVGGSKTVWKVKK